MIQGIILRHFFSGIFTGVYDSHESRQQELKNLADIFLSDYFDLINFWKFASVQ